MLAGWSKAEIKLIPKGYAMHGFGMWHHRAWGQQSALMSRVIVLCDNGSDDQPGSKAPLIFCCMDLGYITHVMRETIVSRLQKELPDIDEERLVLTCTHTHSGPGGCTQDALYNIVTPGYVPAHVAAIVHAAVAAIKQALANLSPCSLSLRQGNFEDHTDVAWNRSLSAYNRNPDVRPRMETETHLALNREMQVLCIEQDGKHQAILSFFGVHATCCGNKLDKYAADNKGEAACQAEAALKKQGADHPVAIFAQATAGDVSPFYHGPGDKARRAAIKGDAHYAYARDNGGKQSQLAIQLADQGETETAAPEGPLDGVLTYVDFANIKADAVYAGGDDQAFTSEPCHGVAFFTGTPIDGPGMPGLLGKGSRLLARRLKKNHLASLDEMNTEERRYYERIYAAQGVKDILLESGSRKRVLGQALDKLPLPGFADPLVKEMKRQARMGALKKSAMVPSVLPLQIIRIGDIAIVCCPGEFTTTAGKRVIHTVREAMAESGISKILITTYCNDYMGYVTTNEEYQQQNYEGGHTIFGQWTLAAFQTCFARLAPQLLVPAEQRAHDRTMRPEPAPADELAKRTNIAPPKRK
jgi:neutral ceramidase